MIISASYKTDIPAFYGPWFKERLAAGWCETKNPYNGKVSRVSLTSEDVDGFVFWTRNVRPFLRQLDEIRTFFPFSVHYTITNYPRALETSVVRSASAIEDLRHLAAHFGAHVAVWRYDPILLSSHTPETWHEKNFAALAKNLKNNVNEVVVSFAHIYRKTKRNLDRAATRHGFDWHDPELTTKRRLIACFRDIARANKMRLTICAQPALLMEGVSLARCIDADRLSTLGGKPIATRQQGNRPDCLCDQSRDIGGYETCPHGCRYCYAVDDHARAKENHRQHRSTAAVITL